MKKKIIALLSAVSMLLPMTIGNVASAEEIGDGVSVVYNAVDSTSTDACYDIYIKGYSAKEVIGVTVSVDLFGDISNIDVSKLQDEKSERLLSNDSDFTASLAYLKNKRCRINANASNLDMSAGVANSFTWEENEPVATVRIPLLTANAILSPTIATAELNIRDGSLETAEDVKDNATVDKSKTQTAVTAEGKVVNENGDAPKATYWTVEANLVEGVDTYWYANVGGADKKVIAEVPTVAGNAVLGLIVEGDATVTNVKVVQ